MFNRLKNLGDFFSNKYHSGVAIKLYELSDSKKLISLVDSRIEKVVKRLYPDNHKEILINYKNKFISLREKLISKYSEELKEKSIEYIVDFC